MKISKAMMISAIVAAVFLVVAMLWANRAVAEEPVAALPTIPGLQSLVESLSPAERVRECVADTMGTAYVYGGSYGAGIGALSGVITLVMSPVGVFTLASGAIYVGITTLTGGAVGLGSSAMTMIGLDAAHPEFIQEICIRQIAEQELAQQMSQTRNSIAESLNDNFKRVF